VSDESGTAQNYDERGSARLQCDARKKEERAWPGPRGRMRKKGGKEEAGGASTGAFGSKRWRGTGARGFLKAHVVGEKGGTRWLSPPTGRGLTWGIPHK